MLNLDGSKNGWTVYIKRGTFSDVEHTKQEQQDCVYQAGNVQRCRTYKTGTRGLCISNGERSVMQNIQNRNNRTVYIKRGTFSVAEHTRQEQQDCVYQTRNEVQ